MPTIKITGADAAKSIRDAGFDRYERQQREAAAANARAGAYSDLKANKDAAGDFSTGAATFAQAVARFAGQTGSAVVDSARTRGGGAVATP